MGLPFHFVSRHFDEICALWFRESSISRTRLLIRAKICGKRPRQSGTANLAILCEILKAGLASCCCCWACLALSQAGISTFEESFDLLEADSLEVDHQTGGLWSPWTPAHWLGSKIFQSPPSEWEHFRRYNQDLNKPGRLNLGYIFENAPIQKEGSEKFWIQANAPGFKGFRGPQFGEQPPGNQPPANQKIPRMLKCLLGWVLSRPNNNNMKLSRPSNFRTR